MSIIQSALKAATFDLPIDPGLGFAYLLPFKNTQSGRHPKSVSLCWVTRATSSCASDAAYKNINVVDIPRGSLKMDR